MPREQVLSLCKNSLVDAYERRLSVQTLAEFVGCSQRWEKLGPT